MFKIQKTTVTDHSEIGQKVSLIVADHADAEQASQAVAVDAIVEHRQFAALEKLQLDALRQAASLLDQVADAIEKKYSNTR